MGRKRLISAALAGCLLAVGITVPAWADDPVQDAEVNTEVKATPSPSEDPLATDSGVLGEQEEAPLTDKEEGVQELDKPLKAPKLNMHPAPKAEPAPDITVKDELTADEAYVSKLVIDGMSTGSAPYDTNDDRGNDSSPDNSIVRSFDKVTYNLKYTTTSDNPMTYYKKTRVGFKVTLPYDSQKAGFDLGSITWADYSQDWKPTIRTKSDGTQTLTCYRVLEPTSESPYTTPGTYTVPFGITVKAMLNGEKVQPTFESWTVPNDAKNRVAKVTPTPVTVSSYPKYDVVIANSWHTLRTAGGPQKWNFTHSGNVKYPSDNLHSDLGEQKGILSQLLVQLTMRNEDKTKGMRGLEVPKPNTPINYSFDMDNKYDLTGSGIQPAKAELQPYFFAVHGQTERIQGGSYGVKWQNTERGDISSRFRFREDWGGYPSNIKNWNEGGVTYNSGNIEVDEQRKVDKTSYNFAVHDWEVDVNKLPTREAGNDIKCGTGFSDTNCNVTEGVVTVGTVELFSPTVIDGKNVQDYYRGSVTLKQHAQVSGIQVKSASDMNVTTQVLTSNDTKVVGQNVQPDGSFSMLTKYNCSTMPWASADYNGTDCGGWRTPDDKHGTDAALRGTRQRISGVSAFKSESMSELLPVMGLNLIKIDDKVLELTDDLSLDNPLFVNSIYKSGTWKRSNADASSITDSTTEVYYAVKKDGKGWVNDEEQKKALIDDLDYYKDYAEAKSHGTPVGILFAMHDTPPENGSDLYHAPTFMVTIKKNAPIGYVAQLTQQAQMWTRGQLEAEAGISADAPRSEWQKYARNTNPLQLRKKVIPKFNDQSWDGGNRDYVKTSYDKDGVYQPGTEGERFGDSLTIIGEKARVSVTTDQAKTDAVNGKNVYDIDNGQRIIDWNVSGYANHSLPDMAQGHKTDWTIDVTIPKGLTYIEGSSYFQGEYKENTPAQGTITGGKQLTPKVTKNADGTTVLRYFIENQPLQQVYRPIHFATTIGDATNPDTDVKNGDEFTVKATINTTDDKSKPSGQNGKIAKYTVSIVRTRASSLATRAVPLISEVNSEIGFLDMVANASNQPKNGVLTIGQLPSNGVAGSKFSGTYKANRLEFNGVGMPVQGNVTLYVTDNAGYSTKDPLKITKDEVIQNFSKVTITNKSAAIPSNTTAFALVIETMPKNTRLETRVFGEGKGNKPADLYMNRYCDTDNTVAAVSVVASREVNGVVWIDANKNGVREDSEELVKDVTVKLKDSNGNDLSPARTVKTDQNGYYEFTELPAGDYTVDFSMNNGKLHKVTTLHAQAAKENTNSDAVSRHKDSMEDGAYIQLATMPALKDMTSSKYVDAHEDMGLVIVAKPVSSMPVTGRVPWLYVLVGLSCVLTLVSCAVMVYSVRKKK